MVEFAGSLHLLAERAYPSWTTEQRKAVLRSQFIHGVQSASVQLHLMKEQPPDVDGALELAVKHEVVEETAQGEASLFRDSEHDSQYRRT